MSPKYSVNGAVNALLTKGDTLIVGGNFSSVGIYTGGGSVIVLGTALPSNRSNLLIGTIYCSTPDNNGGFYIYGYYKRETEDTAPPTYRIEHIRADRNFEPGFSIPVSSVFPLRSIVFSNGILYIGGENIQSINGETAGNLAALDVVTKHLLPWIPAVNGRINDLCISKNSLFVCGSFSTIGNQSKTGLASVEIGTGRIGAWNPAIQGSDITTIRIYKTKLLAGGGIRSALQDKHACALLDTSTGNSIEYIFSTNDLYHAAGVSTFCLKGDTLLAFSSGTFDTRVTAVNLADNFRILWKRYFNMLAKANTMEAADSLVYIAGESISAVYKDGFNNDNDANIEKNVSGILALNIRTGKLNNWSPDPVGALENISIHTFTLAGNAAFIGGNFTHLKGKRRSGLVMFNTKTDEIYPFSLVLDYSSREVHALKLIDSTLYLGGNFTSVNGQPFKSSIIACRVTTGELLSGLKLPLGTALALEATEKYLFAGGNLTEAAGGQGRKNLFAIDRKTNELASWSPNPNSNIYHNALHISKGKLYAGGSFTEIAGDTRLYIASFDVTTLQLNSWQPFTATGQTAILGVVTAITSNETSIFVASNGIWEGSAYTSGFAGFHNQTGIISNYPRPQSITGEGITSLAIAGKHLLAGGSFNSNANLCNGVAAYDLSNKELDPLPGICLFFPVLHQNVDALSIAGNQLYMGGDFTVLNGRQSSPYLDRITPDILRFTGDSDTTLYIFPKQAGNGGDVTLRVYGQFIKPGITLKLVMGGMVINVPDTAISYTSPGELKAIINLRGKTIGAYDIILTGAGGAGRTLLQAFTIMNFKSPDLSVHVLGADRVRNGIKSPFVIQVSNQGNCDAIGVPMTIFTSRSLTISFRNKIADLEGNSVDTVLSAEIDSLKGVPVQAKGFILLLPRIEAGSVVNLRMEVLSPSIQEYFIRAVINEPLFASPIPQEKLDCFNDIIEAALKLTLENLAGDVVNCANGIRDAFDVKLNDVINWGAGNSVNSKGEPKSGFDALDYGFGLVTTAATCATVIAPQLRMARIAHDVIKVADQIGGAALEGAAVGEKCSKAYNHDGKSNTKNYNGVNAVDPNDKIGIGVNQEHHINGKGALTYGIRFENINTATADAQTVRITDTLNKPNLDLSTFQLNSIQLGGVHYPISPGQQHKTIRIDLRPKKNMVVEIVTTLDSSKGIFNTIFSSLDPVTLQPLADPLLGFLPPNKTAPEGEGAVYFSVMPKQSLEHNTILNNKASIYFDNNAPIITPVWSNTIDKAAPGSQVLTLPEVTKDTSFTLGWSGQDQGSGIERFDIYYAVNNGPYRQLYVKAGERTTVFTGKPDSTYSFYSIATDKVGNIETKKLYETKTTITISGDRIDVNPNPSNGNFSIRTNGNKKIEGITIYDLVGKSVPAVITATGANYYQISMLQKPAPGIYFVRFMINSKLYSRKILIL
ncbi:MAG TPA: T9SS type A sorting domain-containing protein [Pseudobacter sp.]|nr:T9SS type A sorting domain-containing protein [Pseudobacter sp.]